VGRLGRSRAARFQPVHLANRPRVRLPDRASFWAQLRECGLCALWNGGVNGGYPALADLFSSKFHPLVALPTLIWGSIAGVKVTIVLSVWMAGAAQWWLARTLRLGRIARLWGAFRVVVGGHLWGRLELGSPGLVLSTAASCLALAAAIELAVTGRRKSALALGITAALAIVSGVGYLQFGLLVWMPALLILLIEPGRGIRPVWKEFVLAGGIALLLTAVVSCRRSTSTRTTQVHQPESRRHSPLSSSQYGHRGP
jgi:hypothetical protein